MGRAFGPPAHYGAWISTLQRLVKVTDKDVKRINTDEALEIRRAVGKLTRILSDASDKPKTD